MNLLTRHSREGGNLFLIELTLVTSLEEVTKNRDRLKIMAEF